MAVSTGDGVQPDVGPTPGATGGKATWFRPDIDGLRAVAIVLVVGFHAGLAGFSGGFVGVDVFFVISGFLITRNLLAETARTERVALLAFWARRIRRLVPAMGLMLLAVMAVSLVVFVPLQWEYIADQGRASALYVSNLFYASRADDYFADNTSASVFLHTWSLGVEEQFYVGWPLLVGAAALLARHRPRLLRPLLAIGFGGILVVSVALSWRFTARGTPWAFYSSPTRAWEFAAGALLALVATRAAAEGSLDRAARRAAPVLAPLGLAFLAYATLRFDTETPYPGLRAAVPVLGTVLLIGLGRESPRGPASRLLATDPAQWLGRLSYSWYLWHWPAILLAVAFLEDSSTTVKALAALLSLPVAYAAHRLVENPVRFNGRLRRSIGGTFLVGGVITLAVVAAAAVMVRHTSATLEEEPYRDLAAALERVKGDGSAAAACDPPERTRSGIEYCVQGDPDGARTVVLVGDSHADQWNDALSEASSITGTRLIARARGHCPAIGVRTFIRPGYPENTSCGDHRAETKRLIEELRPDAVVISQSNGYAGRLLGKDGERLRDEEAVDTWAEAYRSYVAELRGRGVQPIAVIDNPMVPYEPLDCLAREGDAAECDFALEEGMRPLHEVERQLAEEVGLPTISTTEVICPGGTCTTMVGDTVVFFDVGHLTRDFTFTQMEQLVRVLDQAGAASRGP